MNLLVFERLFLACPFFTSSGCRARADSTPSVHYGFNTRGEGWTGGDRPEIVDLISGKAKSAWVMFMGGK
jgi:hypothetical protein